MTTRILHAPAAAAGPRRPGTGALARAGRWLARAHERARQRRALARLDDRLLHDVGLTREQACAEAQRPFWD